MWIAEGAAWVLRAGALLLQALPGQEGLVLLDGVQLIGGRITPFARQLPSGVLSAVAAGDVNVAAAQVPTALQVGASTTATATATTTATATGAVCCIHQDARGQQVSVLEWPWRLTARWSLA